MKASVATVSKADHGEFGNEDPKVCVIILFWCGPPPGRTHPAALMMPETQCSATPTHTHLLIHTNMEMRDSSNRCTHVHKLFKNPGSPDPGP